MEGDYIKIKVNKRQFFEIFKNECIKYNGSDEDTIWEIAPFEVMEIVFRGLIGHELPDTYDEKDFAEILLKNVDWSGGIDTIWNIAKTMYLHEKGLMKEQ